MRAILTLTFAMIANSAVGSIGASLDSAKAKYGAVVKVSTYRPDLYPTSYVFRNGDAKIEVTPLPSAISRLDVFLTKVPKETPEALLERFSGRSGWRSRPLSAPDFEREFPLFNPTDSANSFYVADRVYALLQRDVGDHRLVLMIQTADYLKHLGEYRKKKKYAQ